VLEDKKLALMSEKISVGEGRWKVGDSSLGKRKTL